MSNINILVKFKIRSLSDTYYIVGTSEFGDFTQKLGRGRDLVSGDASSLEGADGNIDEDLLTDAQGNPSGVEVSVPVSLGENFGNFTIRMYAENDLGIRSGYIEVEKHILPADVSGTFRFNALNVANIKIEKPAFEEKVKRRPTKANNVYIKESEFIGQDFKLNFGLKANARLSGNKNGTVLADNPVFSHFEIKFFGSYDSTIASDRSQDPLLCLTNEITNIPASFLYSQEKLNNYTDFSLYLSKKFIVDLYRENNITGQDRKIYIQITGKDVFYNIDVNNPDAHEFVGIAILEQKMPKLDFGRFSLYGQTLEAEVRSDDPDINLSALNLLQYKSGDLVRKIPIVNSGLTTAVQKWDSPSNPNKYKYLLEVNDGYGFAGYYAVNSAGALTNDLYAETDTALTHAYEWAAFLKIDNLSVREIGASSGALVGGFRIDWDIVDSQNNIVDISKDMAGRAVYKIKNEYEVDKISGFTACFVCPEDYSVNHASFHDRDANDIDYLVPENGSVKGEPTATPAHPHGTETKNKNDTVVKAVNGLQIFEGNTLFITKEQNQNIYRSWFNETNLTQIRSGNAFNALLHDEFRKIYNRTDTAKVSEFNHISKFKYVDSQRKLKVRVELIDTDSGIVDELTATGYNPPPVFQLADGDDITLNDKGASLNGNKKTSAVRSLAGSVSFELPANEKIEYVEIFRRPHTARSSLDPTVDKHFYSEFLQDNSDLQNQGTQYYNRKFDSFFLNTDLDNTAALIENSIERMLFNYGAVNRSAWSGSSVSYNKGDIVVYNYQTWQSASDHTSDLNDPPSGSSSLWNEIDLDEDINPGGYGFHVRRVAPMGNASQATLVNGIDLGDVSPNENNMSFQDFPPMLCDDGRAENTFYDYLIVPFDLFGSGQAEFFENVQIKSPETFSQDDRGVIGTLDLDAPNKPESVNIDGANKTFQLNWSPPKFTNDLDHYNLYYILDNRPRTEMFWDLHESNPVTYSKSSENVLNFNTEFFDYEDSDFLERDFDFTKGDNAAAVPAWSAKTAPASWAAGDIVKHRPVVKGSEKAAFRLYRAKQAATTQAPHDSTSSEYWEALPNMTLYDNRHIVYADDIIDQVRVASTSDSDTYSLIYWQENKTYLERQIVFDYASGRCYKAKDVSALTGTGANVNKGRQPTNPNYWEEVQGISITEVKIPSTETSISVVGDTNARGYFYFESVDRSGNRSKLHEDPTENASGNIRFDLGTSTIRDIENFEQELSEEFPNALMLRPDDPFTIDNTANKISWVSHYIYSAGQGYFMPAGEINLLDDVFTANDDRSTTAEQNIRYIYFDKSYGYDVNEKNNNISQPQFKQHHTYASGKTIRDIESDRLNAGLSASAVGGKDRDNDIQYSGYYLFCTGNPASNTYNGVDAAGEEIIDNNVTAVKVSELNKLLTHFDDDNPVTASDSSVNRIVPPGEEPVPNNENGLGTWGIHVQKSETLETDGSKSLFRKDVDDPGTFQIVRIDGTRGNFSKEVNFETINNATIGQANISNATITSAQVTDLSAEKITAGVIGSHKIEIGNSIIPTRENGIMKDAQSYEYERKEKNQDKNIAAGLNYISQGQYDGAEPFPDGTTLDAADQNKFRARLDNIYDPTLMQNAVRGSEYVYGAITSKGFDHNTQGTPGFFISGDGQFGFQTNRGGLYLRDDGSGSPSELVLRGTLVQESSDPFVKIEMSATNQFITFDEHADSHYYFDDSAYKIYGTQSHIISPTDGTVAIEYDIQNARHVDGSPYTSNELTMKIYVDGDENKFLDADAIENLVGAGATQAHERLEWDIGNAYDIGAVSYTHLTLPTKA